MDTPPLTILLVDDQSMFLDGIESLLARLPEVQVVAKATNGLDALAKVTLHKPDLVLMDINMPHMDGIEASKHIRKANPATRVIALSMYGHREFVLELLDSGVGGYLLKTAGKDELLTAIRTVAQGDQYVAQELRTLANKADRNHDREGETRYGPLTSREMQVVKLILHERTTAEIAAELFLSTTTVETHRRNIMHKLDVRNTAGLVKYAMERGWGA
ncbi:MAG: response regulator transcription factor [Flavobacteriales bacterium]|jgi:DNA-binding NarL/FixJ family response regulator|nr:response regulator transcription factor [Flavobacteriales bacterium]